jgi:hypothetical protein
VRDRESSSGRTAGVVAKRNRRVRFSAWRIERRPLVASTPKETKQRQVTTEVRRTRRRSGCDFASALCSRCIRDDFLCPSCARPFTARRRSGEGRVTTHRRFRSSPHALGDRPMGRPCWGGRLSCVAESPA